MVRCKIENEESPSTKRVSTKMEPSSLKVVKLVVKNLYIIDLRIYCTFSEFVL
jgi:hypothetical protein